MKNPQSCGAGVPGSKTVFIIIILHSSFMRCYNRRMQHEFPNARNVCYLNTASEGLLPQSALKAMVEAAGQKQSPQVLGDEQYFQLPSRIRILLASLMGCSSDEIGLVASTSFGFGAVALSLPLKPGDEVLLVERDFPSNNFAWQALRRQEIRIRHVPFAADADQTARVLESITDSTRALSISVVHFYTGFRYDLAALSEVCRRKEIFLVVDAIQAAGNMSLNLEKTPVDALCAAAHKWQMSPSGTGFVYINRSLMPRLKPTFTGWMHNKNATSFANTSMFEFQPSSFTRRFELGTAPYILHAAYEQCLKLLQECRIDYIEQHNSKLVGRLIAFFREIGWNVPEMPRSPSLFSVVPPAKYETLRLHRALAEREIFTAVRENHLRLSPHFYNTDQDIDRFCAEFKKLID